MSDLRQELDRELAALPLPAAPVERARRDGRRRRTRRRAGVLAVAVAVAAVAAGYPALARSAVSGPVTPAAKSTAPPQKLTGTPPAEATRTPDGLAVKQGVIASGLVGHAYWQVDVTLPGTAGLTTTQVQFCYSVTAGNGTCAPFGGEAADDSIAGGDPAELDVAGESGGTYFVIGVVAKDVPDLTVSFTDGQDLKLTPVTVGGHRYVAWAAPESTTVARVTAYLGGAYTEDGRTVTAVPLDTPGTAPIFGLWQKAGQAAAPRGQAVVGRGRVDSQSWSVTASEGPWGTCFVLSTGPGGCFPVRRLASTKLLGLETAGDGGAWLGSAAPGVALVRVALSNGNTAGARPVTVGNEHLFAVWVGKGVTPVSWNAYAASGQEVAHGSAS